MGHRVINVNRSESFEQMAERLEGILAKLFCKSTGGGQITYQLSNSDAGITKR